MMHFFAVAIYAVYSTLRGAGKDGKSWKEAIRSALAILSKAGGIIFPLVWTEAKTVLTF